MGNLRTKYAVAQLALTAFLALVTSQRVMAITLGQVDDFEGDTTQNWFGAFPELAPDAGPQGNGDSALLAMASGNEFGAAGKLVISNGGFQWDGNWTATGVARIAMDVRNPNAVGLSMRVGIAGPDGFSAPGAGDTYVSTDPISIPADNAWHSVTFDVLPDDFTPFSVGNNVNAALADVRHFRILHNPVRSFLGAAINADFYVDNIRALGAPIALAGDYNENGAVDAADYVLWRKTLNLSVTPGEGADGTGPSGAPDGVVNNLDYDFWRARFGNTSPGAGSALAMASVPEPATWVLIFGWIPAVGCRFRR